LGKTSGLLKKPVASNYEIFEIVLSVAYFVIAGLGFWQTFGEPIIHFDYIPNAITGLTTLSGILTALAGYWLSQIEKPKDKKTKRLAKERSVLIIMTLLSGLLLVAGSLTSLVYRPALFAFQISVLGTLIILWAVVDIMFYHVFSSLELEINQT
jgi:hypothetical protein